MSEQLRTAFHEAAHAVLAASVGSVPIAATIAASGGGHTLRERGRQQTALNDATVAAGGLVAETLAGFPGDVGAASEDLRAIAKLNLPRHHAAFAISRAARTLREKWPTVAKLAAVLVSRGSLGREELQALLDPPCACDDPGATVAWRCQHGKCALRFRGIAGELQFYPEALVRPDRPEPASKSYPTDRHGLTLRPEAFLI